MQANEALVRLFGLIEALNASSSSEGCCDDLTVVSASALDNLVEEADALKPIFTVPAPSPAIVPTSVKVQVIAVNDSLPIEYKAAGMLYPNGYVTVISDFMNGDVAFDPKTSDTTISASYVVLPDGKEFNVREQQAGIFVTGKKPEPEVDEHRRLYPEQYTHELCGKRVELKADPIINGTVERVVGSRFGMLAILKEYGPESAWSIHQLTVID